MTKETTQRIKGIAILVMIAHHFLVYDFGAAFSDAWGELGRAFKICVGIYAVLSGYGYYFAKEKTLRHGLKKIWGLLQEYWISLFTIFIPCAIMGGWKADFKSILINLFALGPNLNWNAWYVYFFIFCMLVMPYVYRVFRFPAIVNVVIALAIPYVAEAAIHVLVPDYQDRTLVNALFNCMLYFGTFLIGYLMAQYDVIRKVKAPWPLALLFLMGSILLRIVFSRINTFGFNTDILFAPLFVVGAAKIIMGVPEKFTTILDVPGKYSTGMWFVHAAFFATYTKDYFQPIMKTAKWPMLMYVWLVLLSLALAFVYRKILDGIHALFLSKRQDR